MVNTRHFSETQSRHSRESGDKRSAECSLASSPGGVSAKGANHLLPQGWVFASLTDLVTPRQWKTISTKELTPEGYTVYGANGKIGFYSTYTHAEPTLMITCRGATCGNLHISEPFSYINGNAMALDNQPTQYLSLSFLYSALNARGFDDVISGSAQPQITRQGLEPVKIPLPPLAEQQEIVRQLDTLLAQVEHTQTRLQRIPDILKRFRQSVLADAVSGKLTEEWRGDNKNQLSLEDYKSKLEGFKIKAKKLNPLAVIDGWLNCQIGHVMTVKSGQGLTAKNMAENGNIPVFGGNGITGYHDIGNVKEETIVIGRVGFYCGSVHLTPKSAWVTDNALIVDFSKKLLRKDFANLMLLATNLRTNTSSSAQPVISATKIYPIQIKIPPIEEQIQIVARVEQLFAYADRIEQQAGAALERVNLLSQSILAKAFRGELTAEWRAANPDLISGENSAEALLAKIQAEKKLAKVKKP